MVNLPRDVFLHLFAIITLVVVAVSFGVLAFQYINIYIPDIVSDPYFSKSSYLSLMRYSLATMVIVFPVFIWVSWFIRKDLAKSPEKRDLKIRKWLLYLTLFVAALIIMGDLVALLRSFLEGELSRRFILKVAAILFIAGSILVHYLSELKDKSKKYSNIRFFDWAVVAIVFTGLVAGLFIAGTPQSQRLVRLDERRTSDLQTIQWQIINYWQRKEVLPSTLNDLADPLSGFILPRDPSTGSSYGYGTKDKFTFEICASFDTSSYAKTSPTSPIRPMPVIQGDTAMYRYPDSYSVWEHAKGKVCFSRTIDPELYPPLNKEMKPASS